jgi:hypothetical protein
MRYYPPRASKWKSNRSLVLRCRTDRRVSTLPCLRHSIGPELRIDSSIRLASSLTLGKRQAPAVLPSVRPQTPLARPLASAKACAHVWAPKQLKSRSHINPVKLSVTVPSPLTVKRGLGSGVPAWYSPNLQSVSDKELADYRAHSRKAVQKDGVICLECGLTFKSLPGHLANTTFQVTSTRPNGATTGPHRLSG